MLIKQSPSKRGMDVIPKGHDPALLTLKAGARPHGQRSRYRIGQRLAMLDADQLANERGSLPWVVKAMGTAVGWRLCRSTVETS